MVLKKDIILNVDFATGNGSANFITSDLTKKYVDINSEYTT